MKKKNKNKINAKADSTETAIIEENETHADEVADEGKVNSESNAKARSSSELSDVDDKIIELQANISNLNSELVREVDRRLRLLAEYDNFRRRTQSEYQRLFETAAERVVMKLLPIIDDFQRFLDQDIMSASAEPKSLKQGMELIYKKLLEAIETEGVKSIDSIGSDFDAELHEAIAQIEDESKPVGTIIAEVERGYRMGKKVIRHPKVVVNAYTDKEVESKNE